MILCRYKYGSPKKKSRFICLNCLQENCVGQGVQRGNKQREKGHIKDVMCINKGCNGKVTKNLEVRYCDNWDEMMESAVELHNKFYGNKEAV